MLDSYNVANLSNHTHFVYDDMHGNLKLKTTQEVEKRTFFSFTSIAGLCATIEKNQERTGENGDR